MWPQPNVQHMMHIVSIQLFYKIMQKTIIYLYNNEQQWHLYNLRNTIPFSCFKATFIRLHE